MLPRAPGVNFRVEVNPTDGAGAQDRLRKLRLGDVTCRWRSTVHPADRLQTELGHETKQKKVKAGAGRGKRCDDLRCGR